MSTETFPPLLFKPPYMSVYAHVQCREPEKGQQKVRILKKTIWLCLSRSYSSISQPLPLHPAGCGAYAASPGVSLLRRYSTVCRHLFKSDEIARNLCSFLIKSTAVQSGSSQCTAAAATHSCCSYSYFKLQATSFS